MCIRDRDIRIGQSASLTITTGTATDVLIAPSSAITTVGDRSTVTRRVGETDETVSVETGLVGACLLYTSPSPRERTRTRMPSSP